MKRSYVIVAAVAILLAVGFWLWQRGRTGQTAIDLVELYPSVPAEMRRSDLPLDAAYNVGDHAINGETRKAIYMHPTSRLTFTKVLIPDDARLQLYLGVKQEAWDKASDGVLFRFGVSDGREYEGLLSQHVDPAHNPNDRRWIPVDIDLSAYAGQQVDLIFNTNSSVPGAGDNPSFDFAVWGSPAVVVKP
jgi:hypothetical protein